MYAAQCDPACATQNGGICRYNPATKQKYCDCQQKGWTGQQCSIGMYTCICSRSQLYMIINNYYNLPSTDII